MSLLDDMKAQGAALNTQGATLTSTATTVDGTLRNTILPALQSDLADAQALGQDGAAAATALEQTIQTVTGMLLTNP